MSSSRPHRALRRPVFEVCEPRLVMSSTPSAAWAAQFDSVQTKAVQTPTVQSTASYDFTGVDYVRSTYGFTGRGQTVAVIDTGIAYDSAALGGGFGPGYRVVGGFDFTGEHPGNPFDFGPNGSHGTHVAGIIGSSDSLYTGVAPGVDLVALRVFDTNGGCTFDRIDQALKWVDSHRSSFINPITTVNLSLGVDQNATSPQQFTMLEADLAKLRADGIFVDASAGNNFLAYVAPGLSYPANSPYVVPVASVDPSGALSSFSQRDAAVIAAPGRSIMSTVPDYVGDHNGKDDDFARYSGTSMATGYVSGAAVLLRQAYQSVGASNVLPDQLYQEMVRTADTIHDSVTGLDYHRLNLHRAVDDVIATHPVSKLAGTLGAYDPSRGLFTLSGSSGNASFVFGPHNPGCTPIMGDWNGDGVATVGVYDPTTSTFYLRNSNTAGVADITFTFGTRNAGWLPVAGDFNGDGVDTVGLYNPATQTFYLKNANNNRPADIVFTFRGANASWLPVAGDFNGDRRASLALYNPATATLYVKNATVTGAAEAVYNLGPKYAGCLPVAGDWNKDGTATIGLYNPNSGTFALKNNYSASTSDSTATLAGTAKSWKPIVGNWGSSATSALRGATLASVPAVTASPAAAATGARPLFVSQAVQPVALPSPQPNELQPSGFQPVIAPFAPPVAQPRTASIVAWQSGGSPSLPPPALPLPSASNPATRPSDPAAVTSVMAAAWDAPGTTTVDASAVDHLDVSAVTARHLTSPLGWEEHDLAQLAATGGASAGVRRPAVAGAAEADALFADTSQPDFGPDSFEPDA